MTVLTSSMADAAAFLFPGDLQSFLHMYFASLLFTFARSSDRTTGSTPAALRPGTVFASFWLGHQCRKNAEAMVNHGKSLYVDALHKSHMDCGFRRRVNI